jgi:hypothetical protein
MKPSLTNGVLSNRLSRKMLVTGVVLIATLIPSLAAQDEPEKNCGGLHVAIRAELVRRDPPYTQPPFVMVTFILLNDGESPVNSTEEGWKLFIDGKEQDGVWNNGPQPIGGYGNLNPGESYELGMALELSRFFPEERDYKVYWKGKRFHSSTITVKVTPKKP